jgi:hypothetical protein
MQQLCIIVLAMLTLVNFRNIATNLLNALSALKGGPRPPSHPLPTNDSSFLSRRRSRAQRGCRL